MDIGLRPREPADEAFLRQLFSDARPELAALPLPDAAREQLVDLQWRAQEQEYRRRFPQAHDSVVVVDGQPVGRLLVADTDAGLSLVDVALAPAVRGDGIGTALLTALCEDASSRTIPVRLSVLAGSRAARLYARLGFRQLDEGSFDAAYVELEWRSAGGGGLG